MKPDVVFNRLTIRSHTISTIKCG